MQMKMSRANTISWNYLSWYFGMAPGKSFKQHIMDMGIGSLVDFGDLSEKEARRKKRGALWKAKKIMEADKKDGNI